MSAPQPSSGAPSSITPGSVLAGKYRVQRILGQGGMGVVVEARHIALDERVALKFLLPEYASHPEAAERFLREARAAVKIKSEHVARVTDVGQLEGGEPYMVMEYLDGSDLSNLLEKQGPFSLPDAVDYLIQGCEAIAEAHSYGIVHRDMKPANLFLTRHTDGAPLVKVLDFGISKVTGGGVEALTRTTAAMGSALYMSPEQMQQTRSVDHRTDIYALGVSLYEMLAGKQPFFADTLPQLCAEILTGTPTPLRTTRPEISDHFAAVLERAYARSTAHRYQTVAEFVTALAPFAPARTQSSIDRVCRMAGLPPPIAGAPPQSMPPPAQRPSQGPGQGPGMVPVQISQSQPHMILGAYNGPQSSGAAAAFANGRNTNANLSTTGGTGGSSSKPILFAGIGLVLLALGSIGAFVVFRSNLIPTSQPISHTPASGPEVSANPAGDTNPAGAPSVTSSAVAPPPTTEPEAPVAPTSAPTTPPTPPTADPVVPVPLGKGKMPVYPGAKKPPTTPTTPTPATTPVAPRPTTDVFEGR